MGSGVSVIQEESVFINGIYVPINGTLYKVSTQDDTNPDYDSEDSSGFKSNCTCVFCSRYENLVPYEIELALPCFKCMEKIKNKTYNKKYAQGLYKEIRDIDISLLIGPKLGWLTEEDGINYAKTKNFNITEFKNSFNILKNNGVFLSHKN